MAVTDKLSQGNGSQPVRALEPRYYLDPAIYEQEKREVFYKTWQYAGHGSQAANPGDYFAFAVLDQELFCIRGRDGVLRCFYNVCQHRAHELVQGTGNKRMIVCPYHAWTYRLDGRLQGARNDRNVPGFDRSAICLAEVRVEVFGGFVFVNLNPDAEPMAAWYPEAETELRAYVPDLDRLQPAHRVEVTEACNWKVSVENYSECYHCALVHPTFASGVIDPRSYAIRAQGHCLRHTAVSVDPEKMSYAIQPECNEHSGDYSSWFLWPAFSFQVYPGNRLNTYHWRPLGIDSVAVERDWYAPGGVASPEIEALARQDRDTTVAEDLRLVESVQRGLGSRGYRPGPLIIDPGQGVNSEHSVQALYGWLRDAIGAMA